MGPHLPEHVLGFLQVKLPSCKKSRGKRRLEGGCRRRHSLKACEEVAGVPPTFPDTPRIHWRPGKFFLKARIFNPLEDFRGPLILVSRPFKIAVILDVSLGAEAALVLGVVRSTGFGVRQT